MLFTADRARLNLADDEVARLADACDSRLEVKEGVAWVTVDGDFGDVVLRAGESFVVDRGDVVTVSALRGAASVEVRAHAGLKRCDGATGTRPGRRPTRLDRLFAGITLGNVAVA